MTVIAGVVDGDHVYIGGDSAGISGWDLTVRKDPKVFRNGRFVMGFTTSFRMGQLLRYSLTPPEQPNGMDAHEYMSTLFVDAVRDCLKQGGYAGKENEVEHAGTFLVGFDGRLFCVNNDYQVGEAADRINAIGCGDQVALGAMWASQKDAEGRLRDGLDAAERFSAGVRGPFVVISTEESTP